jgi:hypothetical protein
VNLTPHFTAGELRFTDAPPNVQDNLRDLAAFLEVLRVAGGNVPLRITSAYRPGDTKQHGKGEAADVVPVGVDGVEWARRVLDARARGGVPDFGQLIIYPHTTRHVHVSLNRLGGGRRNEVRQETGRGIYPFWNGGAILPLGTPAGGGDPAAPNNEGASSPLFLLLLMIGAAWALYLVGGK